MDVYVLPTSVGPMPVGFQLLHTPLGPFILFADSNAPPELLAALDGLFPAFDVWSHDPPEHPDSNWIHTFATRVCDVAL